MKKILFLLFVSIAITNINAQENKSIYIAFYNVENLFDTINDPFTKDDDFTPSGKKNWTIERYNEKLEHVSSVLIGIGQNKLPDLVGFAEIENKQVLEDLILSNEKSKDKFKVVHEESPDARGIDVGLIYNKNAFTYLNHKKIPINTGSKYKVRDILYTKGILYHTDTVHIFVNHWKSRSGGQEETEPERIICAQTLKKEVDSVLALNTNAKILIMGDLNDEPNNKSIFETLEANNSDDLNSLYNIMYELSEKGKGTHSYRGKWNMLDNIIVSQHFLNDKNGFIVSGKTGHIYSEDWITFTGKNGNKSPNRTYGGNNYYGGYSDHYPVYVILKKD
jgi:predicted extracellular nuclease